MLQELKRGEKLVKSLLLLRKNGLKQRLERRFVEGEYDEAVVKKKVDRVLVRKDGDIKILFI